MRPLARWLVSIMFIANTFAAVAQESPFGSYTYDGSGNIISIGGDTFVYDELGRLTSATLSHGAAQTFTYDRYGNILTVTTAGDPVIKKLGVDKHTNQIDQALDDNGDPNNVVGTYDARGNLISYPSGTFVYDGLEMMKEATVAGTRRFHIYSASDERVATLTSPGTGDWTIRDPGGRTLRRLTQTNGTFAWTADYIYRDEQLLVTAVPDAEKIRHFHVDHLGTPRLVTGNGGVQVAEHHYQPFGPELPSSTNDTEKAKFTGHERDTTTLDYLHARFYDPFLGRFLSVDPYLDAPKARRSPQAWNRYAYVTNNPVNKIDPDGRNDQFMYGIMYAGHPEAAKADLEYRANTTRIIITVAAVLISRGLLDVFIAPDVDQTAERPSEAYNRQKHYGRTPTAKDRKDLGAGSDEVVNHEPALVKRYYEGDPATGEKPGHEMTPEERRESANDRSRMNLQPKSESCKQGAECAQYSKEKKKEHRLDPP